MGALVEVASQTRLAVDDSTPVSLELSAGVEIEWGQSSSARSASWRPGWCWRPVEPSAGDFHSFSARGDPSAQSSQPHALSQPLPIHFASQRERGNIAVDLEARLDLE